MRMSVLTFAKEEGVKPAVSACGHRRIQEGHLGDDVWADEKPLPATTTHAAPTRRGPSGQERGGSAGNPSLAPWEGWRGARGGRERLLKSERDGLGSRADMRFGVGRASSWSIVTSFCSVPIRSFVEMRWVSGSQVDGATDRCIAESIPSEKTTLLVNLANV